MATTPRSDPGYACGSKDNEGRCAVCPPWCRGRSAYEARMPRFGSAAPSEPLCPECRDGKCRNCIEQAMTDDDELVPCGCPNHEESAA